MPLSPSATRDLLAQISHHPKRALGQNFLVDGNIVHKSLALAEIKPGDAVVEVGPGLGTLTTALLEAGAEVWAIERDHGLFNHLAATLGPRFPDRLHLLEGDAVEFPLAGLPADRAADFKIVANLPYAISSVWMDGILGGPLPARMVLMLQLESAQRFTAPNGGSFGAITIFLQSAFQVAPGHKVAAACFFPRPEVESYLLNLVRRTEPYRFPDATKSVIRGIFQQRRKQIAHLLRDRLPDGGAAWLQELAAGGLSGQARPEAIPLELWRRFPANALPAKT